MKYYLIILGIIITGSFGLNLSYGGVEVGDGAIEIVELNIVQGGGFVNGENIVISQEGATNAIGIFTNLGTIETSTLDSEIIILSNINGFGSQNVTIIQQMKSAQGVWEDLNEDTNVDAFEVTQTEVEVLFENGPISILGNTDMITLATANFTDSEDDIINNGELSITNRGSGFVSGEVLLTGQNSFASTTAQFTDTNIACLAPDSGDWTISSDCIFFSNESAPSNVIIQNNALVTIPNGFALDIDFTNFKLIIKSGSGLLIKSGGTLT